jgi:hypothetical protein
MRKSTCKTVVFSNTRATIELEKLFQEFGADLILVESRSSTLHQESIFGSSLQWARAYSELTTSFDCPALPAL